MQDTGSPSGSSGGAGQGTGDDSAANRSDGAWQRAKDGSLMRKVGNAVVTIDGGSFSMGRPTKEERTERDLLLEKCVYAGLTINQMSALSQTWKYPMQRQHVGRRLKQLGLRKRVKSVQLPHEQGIIEFLIRFEADYWDKEYSAGCGVRADLFLTRKCKTYFYEYQASAFRNKLRQKIRGYVALHKLSEPFRTLFHFRNKIELETAVRMANEEIDTEAEIFLFSSDGQNWTNRWGREKLIE